WFDRLYSKLPPDSVLLLGGLGKMEGDLRELASHLSCKEKIRFVGYISDPATFLPYVHLTLSPSRYEGLPIAILEAAALGSAVAATKTAGALGLSEIVPEIKLLPNEDDLSEEVIADLAVWASKRRMAKENGPNLTESARESLRPERVASSYLALYRKLLS